MGLTPPKTQGKSTRKPMKAGVYPATCIGIYGIGTHEETYQGETNKRNKVILNFEFPKIRREIDVDGEKKDIPQTKAAWYTFSYFHMATLAKHLNTWRGKELTKMEENTFDLFSMLGKNALVTITNKTDDDGNIINDKVSGIMGLMDGMEAFPPELKTSHFSFIDHGKNIPDLVPDWVKTKIMASQEWAFMEDAKERLEPIIEPESGEPVDSLPF